MTTYLKFGIEGHGMDAARSRIERALGITMTPRDSSFHGEYFSAEGLGNEEFMLKLNFDETDGEWSEPSSKESGLILYASETERADTICAALAECAKLISRKEF